MNIDPKDIAERAHAVYGHTDDGSIEALAECLEALAYFVDGLAKRQTVVWPYEDAPFNAEQVKELLSENAQFRKVLNKLLSYVKKPHRDGGECECCDAVDAILTAGYPNRDL